jgi:hypothetical protein
LKRLLNILNLASNYSVCIENPKLFFGDTGYLLFLSKYYLITKDKKVRKKTNALFSQYLSVLKTNISEEDSSLCSGLTGIMWTFNWMSNLGYIQNFENIRIISTIKESISNSIDNDFRKKEYDLFYGLIGKSIYYFNDIKKNKDTIHLILNYVIDISEKDDRGIYWIDYYTNDRLKNINVESYGLAHGIPSIIIFLCKCLEIFPSDKLKKIIASSVSRMIAISNSDDRWSYPDSNVQNIESRLAWCYGDLGVAYSFLIASKSLSDKSIFNEARKMVIKTCQRDLKSSGIIQNTNGFEFDIGLCHGLAGVYLLYQILAENIKEEIIINKETYYYYKLLETLEKFFLEFPPDCTTNNFNGSLFGGLSGPLLTLSIKISKDNNTWKELMLLS